MIKNIFKRKTVKQDIVTSVGILLIFMMIAIGWALYVLYNISKQEQIISQVKDLKNFLLLATYQESTFKLYGYKAESFYDNKLNDQVSTFNTFIYKYDSLLNKMDIDPEKKRKISFYSKTYQKEFNNLLEKQFERGFKDFGKEGTLRQLVHAVENSASEFNPSDLLILRRHEKDFFLRKEKKYVDAFSKSLKDFMKKNVGFSFNNSFEKDKLAEQISTYGEKFYQIVDLEQEIGFTEKDGINGKLMSIVENFILETNRLETSLMQEKEFYQKLHFTILVIVMIIIFTGSIVYTLNLANKIERPINVVKAYLEKLCLGLIPKPLETNTSDVVLKTIISSLNQLRERISGVNDSLRKIGSGKYSFEIDVKSAEDETGNSLKIMRDNLINIKKEDDQRNWSNEGYTMFSNLMRHYHEVNALSTAFISELAHYLKANQIFLFTINENEEDREKSVLKLEAAFAFNKRKFLQKEFYAGEGLTGQCYLEKQTIYLNEVPEEYTEITSGLGDAGPRSVLIVPIKTTEYIVGVIEIASFKEFQAYEIEFCEKLAENLASVLASMKINEHTKHLLETTKSQTENLRMQEEEMRQNLEEMEAIQEEMHRKESEYIRRIEELELQLQSK